MFKTLFSRRIELIGKYKLRRSLSLGIERLENRELMAADANLVAYRPVTNYINFANYPVADVLEADVARGPGIRMNGDSDDGDAIPDRNEWPLTAVDNDLVRVDVQGTGTSFQLSYGVDLALWTSNTKSAPIANLSSVNPGQSVWVEYVGLAHTVGNSAQLMLTVNDTATSSDETDHVVFHSFQSIVLAIGGRNQNPASFPDSQLGIYTMGGTLYNQGYDVHLFAHDHVANNGTGSAYNEVVSAVLNRGVDNAAIMGYSWGGGATYSLSNALNNNTTVKNAGYKLVFTAYVDAFRRDSFLGLSAESRKPIGTLYHVNFYQRKDWLLKGTSVSGANNVNVTTQTSWGVNLVHTTIDDHATLQGLLVNDLITRVIVA